MTVQIPCWQSDVLTLTAQYETENPFLDVTLTARFTGPNGEDLTLAGYWDGGRTYRVRFTPTSVGLWHYETAASNSDPGLTCGGQIECVPYTGDLPIYRHGFLRVSSGKSHLEYADGTPFLWLGDTHWTFATEERWGESNCVQYDSQFRACVDKRAGQGFTVYQCNLREGAGRGLFGKCVELLRETDRGPIPNIDALRDLDLKMQYLADKGFVIALGFAWNNDILRLPEGHYCQVARYMTARYGALPVIWTLAGEIPGYAPANRQAITDQWREVALVTRENSPYRNLMSVHMTTGTSIPETYCGEEWLDFVMCQTGHGDYPASCVPYRDFRAAHPDIPLVESETFYEGIRSLEQNPRTVTPDMFRHMAYAVMQSGGCGFTYGCNGVWELQWEAGVGGIGWGDLAWWDGLNLPGADQLTIWRRIYEYALWAELKPIDPRDMELTGFWLPFSLPDSSPMLTTNEDRTTVVGYFVPRAWRGFTLRGVEDGVYSGYAIDPATGFRTPVAYGAEGGCLRVDAPKLGLDMVLILKKELSS